MTGCSPVYDLSSDAAPAAVSARPSSCAHSPSSRRRAIAMLAALAIPSAMLAACSKGHNAEAPKADACSPDDYDRLLQKHVRSGKVDYAALKGDSKDMESFNKYLERLGTCDASKLTGTARDAFWVNAYNAFNIKGVLDNYPLENIKSVNGFLDKKQWRVAQLDLTLNDMEYKQLIPARKDARNHFAVVCADLGSVPLESHAYTAGELEAALDKKARDFVADPHNFTVDIPGKTVRVSMLFSPEWYEKDFLADARFHGKKAVEYLIPYVDKPTAEFLASGDYTVSYIDWDWSLNGATASK